MEDFTQYRKTAPVNLALISANILVFLWVETHGGSESTDNMLRFGAVFAPLIVEAGQYWRLVTAAFLHFGIEHIANNMLFLFLLGDHLEREMGHVRYLFFYLLCAVCGNLCSLAWDLLRGTYAVSAGASGALFGVIGGLLYALMRNRGRLGDLSTRQVALLAGLSVLFGLTDRTVDSSAHIGGLAAGFLLAGLFLRGRRGQPPRLRRA